MTAIKAISAKLSVQSSGETMQRRNAEQVEAAAGAIKSPRTSKNKPKPKLRVTRQSLKRSQRSGRDSSNKVRLTSKIKSIVETIACHFLPDNKGIFQLEPIPARYDQITISLYTKLPMKEVKQNFVKSFGEPEISLGRKFWLFNTPSGNFEVSSSRARTKFYHVIKLRNLALLPLLAPVMERFIDLPPDGGPVAKLASAEIAFDIPFPADIPYLKAERILKHLALFILPFKNNYAKELSFVSGKEFQRTADGAWNGKYTIYVGRHRNIHAEEAAKKNKRRIDENSTWKGIIYLKAFYEANGDPGAWHIRFEVELSDQALARIGGNYLSFDVETMNTRLGYLALHDFWRTGVFEWERFINEARERSKGQKRIAPRLLINLSSKIESNSNDQRCTDKKFQNKWSKRFKYTVKLKNRAYRIAHLLDGKAKKALLQQLWDGNFIRPLGLKTSAAPKSPRRRIAGQATGTDFTSP